MHDKHMQKHDDLGAMNNVNSYPQCPWPPSPLWGSCPPRWMALSSRRSPVHDPRAGLVIAGHCGLSARGWPGSAINTTGTGAAEKMSLRRSALSETTHWEKKHIYSIVRSTEQLYPTWTGKTVTMKSLTNIRDTSWTLEDRKTRWEKRERE